MTVVGNNQILKTELTRFPSLYMVHEKEISVTLRFLARVEDHESSI